jgi:hypothetical protein
MHAIRIGKRAFLFLVINVVICTYAESVTLSLHDAHGMPTVQCIKDVPYSLQVTMRDMQRTVDPSALLNLPDGIHLHRSKTVSRLSDRGHVTATYMYTISADQLGNHTIGPIDIDDGTTHHHSNTLSITVVKPGNVAPNHTNARAMLTLHIGPHTAYVGQDISCTLKFYFLPNHISLEQIGRPEIPNVLSSAWSGPSMRSEDVNGIRYECAEWHWLIRFTHPGNYEIPAYRGDYRDTTKRRHGFALFFNDMAMESVYSEGHALEVKPIPEHPSGTSAVGNIREFRSELDRTQCSVGDAALLSLTVFGEGNFFDIPAPLLNGMPPELKYYDSKKEIVSGPAGSGVRFEYVVQPLQEGVWEIPQQQYIYFDPEAALYKTSMSNPLYFTVLPSIVTLPHDSAIQSNEGQLQSDIDSDSLLRPLRLWSACREPFVIPWPLFLALIVVPLLCVMFYRGWRYYTVWYTKTDRERRARNAFMIARTTIKKARAAHDIYTVWQQFFADRGLVDVSTVTEIYMRETVEYIGLPATTCVAWDSFLHDCMSARFAKPQETDVVLNTLRAQSFLWLDILEKHR